MVSDQASTTLASSPGRLIRTIVLRILCYSPNESRPTCALLAAGGKRSIIEELAVNVPAQFNDYYEAFIGGGALFYHLHH